MMEHNPEYQEDTPASRRSSWRDSVISFSTDEFVHNFQLSRSFKLHVITGVGLSLLATTIWLFVEFFRDHWPWFIHVWALFLLTISFHFYFFIRPKELLQLHVTWFVILNTMFLVSWFFARSTWGTPWFLYTFFGLSILLAFHFIYQTLADNSAKHLYFHFALWCLISVLCFSIWLEKKGYPWFIYPFYSLALTFAIHYSLFYHPGNLLNLHFFIFLPVQLMLFFAWGSVGGFPWFFFVLIGWGLLLLGHWWKFKPTSSSTSPENHQSENPPEYYPQETPQVGLEDQQN